MSEHVFLITEINHPEQASYSADPSRAVIDIMPPLKEVGPAFPDIVVGNSRPLSVRFIETTVGRSDNRGITTGRSSFLVEAGNYHYSQEQREEAIKKVAQRMCALADNSKLALRMITEDPVPHKPVSPTSPEQ